MEAIKELRELVFNEKENPDEKIDILYSVFKENI